MENRPVISLTAISRAPGADLETWERFQKWRYEVYGPISMNLPSMRGIDRYKILGKSPEYPETMTIGHYVNLRSRIEYGASQENSDIIREFKAWSDRGIAEQIWSTNYALVKGFRSKTVFSSGYEDTRIENAPVMHWEAFRLSVEEKAKYFKWLNDYGITIFIPLFLKLPGLVGYDYYEDTGVFRKQDVREQDYPKYLSIVYFENIEAYDIFLKSPELEGFQKVLRSVFPQGLKYEWYVQYQLIKSWRK